MKTKHYIIGMVLAVSSLGFGLQPKIGAQETTQIQPSYSNHLDAQQAALRASRDANATNTSLESTLAHLNEAEEHLGQMQISGNQQQRRSAINAANESKNKYAGMLSAMSGVSKTDINAMHSAGVGWSNMAGELGMHVSTTHQPISNNQESMRQEGHQGFAQQGETKGVGSHQISPGSASQRDNAQRDSVMEARSTEIMSATERNTESGWAEGHGTGLRTGEHRSEIDGMMSGAGGLSNGMGGNSSDGRHSGGGMSGGMSAPGRGGGGTDAGGMGGESGSGGRGGPGGGGGSGGGHGGGGGSGGGGMH